MKHRRLTYPAAAPAGRLTPNLGLRSEIAEARANGFFVDQKVDQNQKVDC
jgi:hypothetical protein